MAGQRCQSPPDPVHRRPPGPVAEAWRRRHRAWVMPRNLPAFTYDALSIKRQRCWLGLKLIALSVWITLREKWEHRGKKF